jgi:putative cardiolipin synthase
MTLAARFTVLLTAATCFLLSNCTVAPKAGEKPVTGVLAAPTTGTLASASSRLASGRSRGESSFLLLVNNKEALDWRLALIDEAQSSIDIQVYLWRSGSSGRLLFDRLLRAADRGVRVRLLVDDFLFSTNEKVISSLCRHQPNLDIRIFNPTLLRGNPLGSTAEFILNFQHLNRRMHNKTWTVDRTFTIVGGRNISDHYFGLDDKYNFIDLDVLAAGPVVNEVSDGFDLFWNSTQAYPGALLSKRAKPEDLIKAEADLALKLAEDREGRLRSFSTTPRSWSKEFASLSKEMVTGRGQFLQDHPDPEHDDRQVVNGLQSITKNQKGEIILVSPYLIPSKDGLERLANASRAGMEVGILAPTLAANNQAAAHGKYRKKRKSIVEGGAKLYEMRHDPSEAVRSWVDTYPVRCKDVALHMKAVVGDRERCFIGSLNLDPRAMVINTESGLLIDSPELTNELMIVLRDIVRGGDTWKLGLNERDKLTWTSRGETRDSPPPARFMKKFMARVVGWLPIENQL